MSIEYIRVNVDNWLLYKQDVLKLEEIFPESIRCDLDLLEETMLDINNIAYVAVVDNKVAGYGLAEPLLACLNVDGCNRDKKSLPNTLYLSSCSVYSEYRNIGISKGLRQYRITEGLRQGYNRFTAHIRTGKMPDKHIVIESFDDWNGYGSFDYLEILI